MEACPEIETLITSSQLRLLTPKKDGNFYSEEQELAIKKIEDVIKQDNKADASMNMNILLYSDPTKLSKEDSKYIIKLLHCGGVVIKYLEAKEEQHLRVSLRSDKLFLSMSKTQEEKVGEGILYDGLKNDNPLLTYYRKQFNKEFGRAKQVVARPDKIVYADNMISRVQRWLKSDRGINVISLCCGALGVLLAILGLVLTFRVVVHG